MTCKVQVKNSHQKQLSFFPNKEVMSESHKNGFSTVSYTEEVVHSQYVKE